MSTRTQAPGLLSRRGRARLRNAVLLGSLSLAGVMMVNAQTATPEEKLRPLPGVKVPEPAALGEFVKNRAAAIALGKALYWDMNLGSDGRTACASCHYQAGADIRVKNQIDPNLANVDPAVGVLFNRTRSGGAGGPNYTLRKSDFPTYGLHDPTNRNSAIVFESNDVIGSTGVFFAAFDASGRPANFGGLLKPDGLVAPLRPGQTGPQPVGQLVNGVIQSLSSLTLNLTSSLGLTTNTVGVSANTQLSANTGLVGGLLNTTSSLLSNTVGGVLGTTGTALSGGVSRDACDLRMDEVFSVHGTDTRRVTGRNSPPTVNAVFNHRNFWDGRANNVFNGSSPFGDRDPDAGIWVPGANGLQKVRIALENSSLASQAVGPVNSEFEMACAGRLFPNVGQRLLPAKALAKQVVAPDDSVLAGLRPRTLLGLLSSTQPGLTVTYGEMVQAAFHDKFWSSPAPVTLGGAQYTQAQANFALFFGLALQMYQGTLVSDQTPLDAYLMGDKSALTLQEQRGLAVFSGKGKCIACHNGPQLTNAATYRTESREFVERQPLHDGSPALYDGGFYNIGVRPTPDDIGLGALDPWGNPLSFTRQYKNQIAGGTAVDRFSVDTCKFESDPCTTPPADARDAVDGAFKTSGLRNIELTGPYFHNGSVSTLEQLVEFYNRGGNARGSHASNTSGFGPNPSNLLPDITALELTAGEQADLVAFMKRPLNDARVVYERAPFDHPQLFIPNGHVGNESAVVPNAAGNALDTLRELPAVGRRGRSVALKPFVDGLPY
jgi:cytochrome c peroxidase